MFCFYEQYQIENWIYEEFTQHSKIIGSQQTFYVNDLLERGWGHLTLHTFNKTVQFILKHTLYLTFFFKKKGKLKKSFIGKKNSTLKLKLWDS